MDIAVLGATGVVGQKIVRLLLGHPQFTIAELSGSKKNRGILYGAIPWEEKVSLPQKIKEITLIDPEEIVSPIVISALPNSCAPAIEDALLKRGIHVITNASFAREKEAVPLVIPEVNPTSLQQLSMQKTPGKHIAGTNCVVAFLAPALFPLLFLQPIQEISIVTLQAISGAGRSGWSALQIQNNTIPYIAQEEEKICFELRKIFSIANLPIAVTVNRVPVIDGHSAAIHLYYQNPIEKKAVWEAFAKQTQQFPKSYVIHTALDAPQPKLLTDDDMRVHIGRIRVEKNRVSFVAMAHNLVRGAAGACLASALLAFDKGLFRKELLCV